MPRNSKKRPNRNAVKVAKKPLSEQVLRRIIRRVVEVAQPEKIILFGSAARGEMGPHSDVDLLVVKSNVHRRKLAQEIYRHLIGVGQAVDIVVVTPGDIERYRTCPALIIEPALREGRVVYAA
jgi:predicted nucleotidyltransferase